MSMLQIMKHPLPGPSFPLCSSRLVLRVPLTGLFSMATFSLHAYLLMNNDEKNSNECKQTVLLF